MNVAISNVEPTCNHLGAFDTRHMMLTLFNFTEYLLQAAQSAGMSESEVEETLTISADKEVKDRLKSATAEANKLGVSNNCRINECCLYLFSFYTEEQ